MPNWCENDLRITGSKKELKRFKAFAKGTEEDELLSCEKFIPYPDKFKKQDELANKNGKLRQDLIDKLIKKGTPEDKAREKAFKDFPAIPDGFNQGGYDWCVKNWGTKWGFCDIHLEEENLSDKEDKYNEFLYSFNTAWSPATPVIQKMGEMFPLLEFDLRYFEQGAGFNGIFWMKDGKVEQDKTGEYFGNRGG